MLERNDLVYKPEVTTPFVTKRRGDRVEHPKWSGDVFLQPSPSVQSNPVNPMGFDRTEWTTLIKFGILAREKCLSPSLVP